MARQVAAWKNRRAPKAADSRTKKQLGNRKISNVFTTRYKQHYAATLKHFWKLERKLKRLLHIRRFSFQFALLLLTANAFGNVFVVRVKAMHIFLEPVVSSQFGSRISIFLQEDATVSKLHDTVESTCILSDQTNNSGGEESTGATKPRSFWLVFRGRCLQDGDLSLSSIGLMDGDVVRVVRRKSCPSSLLKEEIPQPDDNSSEQVMFADSQPETLADESSGVDCSEIRPMISEIQPSMGLSCGGSKVQIVGKHFRHGLRVRFGRTVVGCTTYSDTLLTCVTPSHAPGVVSVQVDVSGLGHFVDDNCLFTYVDYSVFHNIFAVAAQNSNPVRVPNESCKEMNEEQLTNRRR